MAVMLTADLEEQIEAFALRSHRDASALAEDGLRRFLAYREGLERAVNEGRAAAQSGDLIDHEVAMTEMDLLLEHG